MDFQEFEYSFNNSVFEIHSDFKAETIATAFMHKGMQAEHIILRSIGTSTRSYKKDIKNVTLKNINNIDYVFIDSPQEGIYDSLPESIFHSFSSSQSKNNTLELIDEIRRHRNEEEHARNFFLPFEQEFFNIKLELFSFEEAFENHSEASVLIRIFKPYFDILHNFSAKKAYLFIRIIPYINKIRNDFVKAKDYLELLLECSVEIKELIMHHHHPAYINPTLGNSLLGEDFIIGNEIHDGEFDLQITIKSNTTEQIAYEKMENLRELTHMLCDYFFSAHYDITVTYEYTHTDSNNLLDGNNVLGMSLVCN